MNSVDSKFKIVWDNKGIDKDSQSDWSQTLHTIINEITVKIYKSTFLSCNLITIHSSLLPLFERLNYYSNEKKMLNGRFKLKLDDTLDTNKIFISSKLNKRLSIPFYKIIVDEYGLETEHLQFKPDNKCTLGEVEDYKTKSYGVITIENYEN